MRRVIFAALGLSIVVATLVPALADAWGSGVRVRGPYRSDGTYVQPHYRSAPNGNRFNNWSTK
jgi:hypothetical protein